jgi:S-adenosylmethionine decarboxylase proenzyme
MSAPDNPAMRGLQLTADLYDCAPDRACMSDLDALRTLCLESVQAAGLEGVRDVFHRFAPSGGTSSAGITGVVLLAESHLAVHTWPELAAVTLDVYVCNYGGDNSQRANALLDALIAAFGARDVQRQSLQRGALPARPLVLAA